MSYMALYREWRPRVFEDVVGQDAIVKTLKNQIISDRIPHAYLFCGTRGTGKTSIAKILSKAVNCLNPIDGDPCNQCEMCREVNAGTLIDVVEIDAASNNRVENIREIIEDVKYPPHSARYKVYIIDEVHMLSISAFNALLKTLEEPPKHVIFILATTDPQKVPATILSRCQRYDFKRILTGDIVKRLRIIVDSKGIEAEDKTLSVIARVSDGAMRDALSILDQCIGMSKGKIEYDDIYSMLGLTSSSHIFNLVDSMIDNNIEECIKMIDDIILNGKDVLQFIKDITKHFRNLLMVKVSKNPEEIIDASDDTILAFKDQGRKIHSEEIMRAINIFSETENDAKFTSQQRILLEIAIIKFCKRQYDTSPEMILNRIRSIEEKIKSGDIVVNNRESSTKNKHDELGEKQSTPISVKAADKVVVREADNEDQIFTIDDVRRSFKDVLGLLNANKNKVVETLLAQGDVLSVKGNHITIQFSSNNSINKTIFDNDSEKIKIAEEGFSSVLNTKVRISFEVEKAYSSIEESINLAKELFGEDIVEVRNN